MNEQQQIEQQLFILRKKFSEISEFEKDGKRNPKFYPLKNKIINLEKELQNINWNEYLSK